MRNNGVRFMIKKYNPSKTTKYCSLLFALFCGSCSIHAMLNKQPPVVTTKKNIKSSDQTQEEPWIEYLLKQKKLTSENYLTAYNMLINTTPDIKKDSRTDLALLLLFTSHGKKADERNSCSSHSV